MPSDKKLPPGVDPDFWRFKSLDELSPIEWELLCDGCGKCCLNKLEDEDTGDILYTNVACRLFDLKSCRCSNYVNRRRLVPDCHQLTPKKVRRLPWLPASCAYKLIDQGHELPEWHHLRSGSRQTIHKQGCSVRGRIVSENDVKDLEEHIVDWLP